jgi:hypothetical protein
MPESCDTYMRADVGARDDQLPVAFLVQHDGGRSLAGRHALLDAAGGALGHVERARASSSRAG